ncbi:histone H1-like [Scomber scombrus]|uniref:Histone H1-like n=1 Tax=Scomber scombrus TaxID=13677 RepID=A0AAV1P2Y3_SCOSC|nr:histone H1.5-like [Scomber scombrus]
MRRKGSAINASSWGALGHANISVKARENAPLTLIKLIGRPSKTPAGKGLGKAGAKRLGRLLKRAIQRQEESNGERNDALPKTPVRLFKYQIQNEAENAPKTNTEPLASPHVSKLILSVVSQCKHQGGISMAELKQTLAAGGYNVTKNNRRVNVATKRLVNNETLVRTTRNATFSINNKKLTDTTHLRTSQEKRKSPQPNEDLKQSNTASKPPKGAGKSHRPARQTPRAAGKSRKPNGKSRKPAAKSPKGKTRKPAAKSQKPRGKTHKPAAKSQKPRGKTHKPAAKSQKSKGKTRKPAAKSQKPKGKTLKPTAKSQKPKGKTRKPAAKSQKPKGKTRKPAAISYRLRSKTLKARRKSAKPAGRKRRPVNNRAAQVRRSPRSQRARSRGPKQNSYKYKCSQRRQQRRRRFSKMRLRSRPRQRRVARRRAYY